LTNKQIDTNEKMKKKSIKELTPACTRKRAQGVRQNLPESPVAWATTLSHIIKNATPRRKSMFYQNSVFFVWHYSRIVFQKFFYLCLPLFPVSIGF
jgi:hypothetical protein